VSAKVSDPHHEFGIPTAMTLHAMLRHLFVVIVMARWQGLFRWKPRPAATDLPGVLVADLRERGSLPLEFATGVPPTRDT
jgi:hypothetical protein